MSDELQTLLEPTQIKASKSTYKNLFEQLEFGRFTSIKSGAAPTLYQEVQGKTGVRRYTLPQGTFTVGDHSLMVFVNGQLQRIGEFNDYIEIDSRTIEFTHDDITEDDVIVFRVAGGTSGPSLHESYIAEEGQTVFTLAGSYTTENHSLLVFVNGAFQTVNVDYEETNPKTVTFLEPLEAGDKVTFRVEGLPTIASKYENSVTTNTYDNEGRIIRREVVGDTRVIYEYQYDANGFPQQMTIHEGGYTITTTYTWENGRLVGAEQTVKEVS